MKKRVISALIMSLVLAPIIVKGGLVFKVALFIIGFYSIIEMINAFNKKNNIPIIIRILLLLLFFVYQFLNIKNISKGYFISYRAVSLMVVLLLLIPLVFYNDKEEYNLKTALELFSMLMIICLGFGTMAILRERNLSLFIFVFLIPIFNDIFAYIGGSLIGKHYLCPNISPKKTWEGLITALVLSTLSMTLLYLPLFNDYNAVLVAFIILLLSFVSAMGDLFFSLLKRNLDIKDFSNIIPGHGGILDRLDSILFVFIAYSIIVGLV